MLQNTVSLFPKGYSDEVMIQCIVLSADRQNNPDVLGMVGASAALMLAPDIPFLGPTGSVRVGKVDGELVLNPTHAELEQSSMNLIISGTEHAVTMLEGRAHGAAGSTVLDGQVSLRRYPFSIAVVAVENGAPEPRDNARGAAGSGAGQAHAGARRRRPGGVPGTIGHHTRTLWY